MIIIKEAKSKINCFQWIDSSYAWAGVPPMCITLTTKLKLHLKHSLTGPVRLQRCCLLDICSLSATWRHVRMSVCSSETTQGISKTVLSVFPRLPIINSESPTTTDIILSRCALKLPTYHQSPLSGSNPRQLWNSLCEIITLGFIHCRNGAILSKLGGQDLKFWQHLL